MTFEKVVYVTRHTNEIFENRKHLLQVLVFNYNIMPHVATFLLIACCSTHDRAAHLYGYERVNISRIVIQKLKDLHTLNSQIPYNTAEFKEWLISQIFTSSEAETEVELDKRFGLLHYDENDPAIAYDPSLEFPVWIIKEIENSVEISPLKKIGKILTALDEKKICHQKKLKH
jgi:hypothetical protein